jgi:hypothetical protein
LCGLLTVFLPQRLDLFFPDARIEIARMAIANDAVAVDEERFWRAWRWGCVLNCKKIREI